MPRRSRPVSDDQEPNPRPARRRRNTSAAAADAETDTPRDEGEGDAAEETPLLTPQPRRQPNPMPRRAGQRWTAADVSTVSRSHTPLGSHG